MSKDDPVSLQETAAGETSNASSNGTPEIPVTFVRRLLRSSRRLLWRATKKMAYVGFIIVSVALILIGLDKLAEFALSTTYLRYLYPGNFGMVKRDLTEIVSHYDYDLRPGVCVLHSQTKGNRYEYTNNAGFRDPRSIPVDKPGDEFRIFLQADRPLLALVLPVKQRLSSNFYYIEHRETISHVLEKILNATAPIPGKTIRVYNTAVWGYSYQHLLLRYITKLRKYNPDLVISLDGANELSAVTLPLKDWDYFQTRAI